MLTRAGISCSYFTWIWPIGRYFSCVFYHLSTPPVILSYSLIQTYPPIPYLRSTKPHSFLLYPTLYTHYPNTTCSCHTYPTSPYPKRGNKRKKLCSVTFVRDLAALKNVLREISSLSLLLQRQDICVVKAISATAASVPVLHALKGHDGQLQKKSKQFSQQWPTCIQGYRFGTG